MQNEKIHLEKIDGTESCPSSCTASLSAMSSDVLRLRLPRNLCSAQTGAPIIDWTSTSVIREKVLNCNSTFSIHPQRISLVGKLQECTLGKDVLHYGPTCTLYQVQRILCLLSCQMDASAGPLEHDTIMSICFSKGGLRHECCS